MNETTILRHDAFERQLVREYCEILYVPSIWQHIRCDKNGMITLTSEGAIPVSDEYIKAKEKAKTESEKILADPEKNKAVVGAYLKSIKEKRIGALEAELEELKNEDGKLENNDYKQDHR